MLSNISLVALTKEPSYSSNASFKIIWYSTLEWGSCIVFIIKTLLKGNTRIISGNIDTESFYQIVQDYKVDYALVPPILVNDVAKSDLAQNYDLRSLKTFILVGCKHSKNILEGLRRNIPVAFIYNYYGSTEIEKISSITSKSKCMKSAGFVAANCQIKFVALNSGEVLGPNQEGEIIVKAPTPMIGYYKDHESMRQAFVEEGWCRTGDVGYYDKAGAIFIVDRIKDIMKFRNYQIAPAEIEELLLSHPEVQEAAVVSIPHELDGDWPVAFIKRTPGGRVTEDDIVKLTSVLEDYKKLRGGIHFIDNLPQTRSGKVARYELRQLAVELKNSN